VLRILSVQRSTRMERRTRFLRREFQGDVQLASHLFENELWGWAPEIGTRRAPTTLVQANFKPSERNN
jgi:hypothetical protein